MENATMLSTLTGNFLLRVQSVDPVDPVDARDHEIPAPLPEVAVRAREPHEGEAHDVLHVRPLRHPHLPIELLRVREVVQEDAPLSKMTASSSWPCDGAGR